MMIIIIAVQAFLEANKLKLIIRSHEGPDARWKREGMQDMAKGHSLDHTTPGQQPTSLATGHAESAHGQNFMDLRSMGV